MPKPNDRSAKPLKIAERDVAATIKDYLTLRGWDAIRQNAGPFGKTGVCDYIFLHYRRPAILLIEFKSPTDKRKCRCEGRKRGKCTVCSQREWAERVRSMGASYLRMADVDLFMGWYEQRFGREGQLRLGEGA